MCTAALWPSCPARLTPLSCLPLSVRLLCSISWQSKRKLEATKRALEAATVLYMIVLAVLCVFDRLGEAMTMHLMVLGLSVVACGVGSAKVWPRTAGRLDW